jgi:hypothetical protein
MTQIIYRLEPRHLRDYHFAIRDRLSRSSARGAPRSEWQRGLLFGLACAALYFGLVWLWPRMTGVEVGIAELVTGLVLGMAMAVGAMWWQYEEQRRLIVKPGGPSLAEHALAIDGAGVAITGQNFESRYKWSIFEDASRYSDILVLWIEPGAGIIVPRAALGGIAAEDAFLAEVKARAAEAKLPRSGTFAG